MAFDIQITRSTNSEDIRSPTRTDDINALTSFHSIVTRNFDRVSSDDYTAALRSTLYLLEVRTLQSYTPPKLTSSQPPPNTQNVTPLHPHRFPLRHPRRTRPRLSHPRRRRPISIALQTRSHPALSTADMGLPASTRGLVTRQNSKEG